jgi:hypothetical protein
VQYRCFREIPVAVQHVSVLFRLLLAVVLLLQLILLLSRAALGFVFFHFVGQEFVDVGLQLLGSGAECGEVCGAFGCGGFCLARSIDGDLECVGARGGIVVGAGVALIVGSHISVRCEC